jgi:hypothetical protein
MIMERMSAEEVKKFEESLSRMVGSASSAKDIEITRADGSTIWISEQRYDEIQRNVRGMSKMRRR